MNKQTIPCCHCNTSDSAVTIITRYFSIKNSRCCLKAGKSARCLYNFPGFPSSGSVSKRYIIIYTFLPQRLHGTDNAQPPPAIGPPCPYKNEYPCRSVCTPTKSATVPASSQKNTKQERVRFPILLCALSYMLLPAARSF